TTNTGVQVQAATSTSVNFSLEVGAVQQAVTVEAAAEVLQTENASNGGTVNQTTMVGLPLTNRNYTQILALSPGVSGQVPNAATLGRNTVNVNVNGTLVSDNSFQMDGQDVSNLQSQGGSDTVALGGISIPSPDAISEFRVQTSQYDASYGRGSGANVEVITKSGTNQFHGDLFEFVRNDIFNANDFFLNRNSQPRPILKQNQFGGTLGGPILKDKLFFFTSYQGTRQVIGEGSGSLQSVILPALTNDRSAAALGRIFAGQKGQFGGVGVAADGSNINPVALALLNYKMPSGAYLIPSPQTIQGNVGTSVFSIPSRFTEDQALGNIDYLISPRNRLSARYFWSRDPETQSFTSSNVPGAALGALFENTNFSAKYTLTAKPTLINELSVGYHRIFGQIQSQYPVQDSQIGLAPPCGNPTGPIMTVTGSFILGGNFNDGQFANTKQYSIKDQVSWVHSSHNIRAGFEAETNHLPFADPNLLRGSTTFNSFPDFLLGLSAAQNGSAFSNVFASTSYCGDTSHDLRVNDYGAYVQDDWKVTSRLTVNLGLRWDIYGQSTDINGRLVNFFPNLANNNFDANGQTYSGLVVPGNYKGTPPAGVLRNNNTTFAENGIAWKSLGPRIGLSWQPGFANRIVVRSGFGIYYGRTSVNDAYQQCCNLPYLQRITGSGATNAAASFQNPFVPTPLPITAFPIWLPRTINSNLSLSTIDQHWQPPTLYQWTFDVQYKLTGSMVAQVGYVGNHGHGIEISQNIDQPYLASPSNPINGVTTNTLSNASLREPYLGFAPTGLTQRSFIGISNYDALQVSLQKRFSRGLQFQVSYTYSKAMTDLNGYGVFPNTGGLYNNAHAPENSYGPADFNIPQRFIAHFVYEVPSFHSGKGLLNNILSGWGASGVITIQNGLPLTFTDNRSGTIYGTSAQLAQLCPSATYGSIITPGPLKSKLDNFFNTSAFCAPPTFVDPSNPSSIGYGFGSMGRSVVYGPGQYNSDLSLSRRFKLPPSERSALEIRGEFYNALNTPQFATVTTTQGATPITRIGVANFGHITSTSVAPRLIQFGIKYLF
ncbi:MAG TPA: TonB-dependent receptor, partial [Bryobacteraceae bacterium]|nr:TonB-dependent receptor [Bryobacteraceae bacterium]